MSTGATETLSAENAGKSLGLNACFALVVGNMIGSGIFLLPSALAEYGPISLLGWALTSTGAVILALIFGRLARRIPKTGGPYAYSRAAFGEFAGFLIGWGYWIALWAGNAAVAVAFSGYLAYFFPVISANKLIGLGVALTAIWTITWINVRGVKEAGTVQVVATIMKVLPLVFLASVGVFFVDTQNLTPLNISGHSNGAAVAACAALTLWAFLGLESATVPAGEVRNPETTIPVATVLGTLFAAALYILVTIAAIGIVPAAELKVTSAPLAEAASRITGSTGAWLVALGACAATLGTLNGFTLLAGQVPLGAARDGLFPQQFAKLTPQGTPAVGLIVSNLLASALIAMNFSKGLVEQFTLIILLATLATLVPYVFCALAELLIILREGPHAARADLPKVLILALLGFIYGAWTIYGAGAETVFWGFLLLIAGLPVFVWIKWRSGGSNASAAAMETD